MNLNAGRTRPAVKCKYELTDGTSMSDDPFKVDENGITSDGYRRLDRACLKSMYLGNLIGIVLIDLILGAGVRYAVDWGLMTIGYVLIAILVAVDVYLIAGPVVFYRRYRYKIDEDKIDCRKGIVIISHWMVPVERIHEVEVSRGPINRIFGLADVSITTAGGITKLQYLKSDVAEDIADKLNAYVVKMLKERD